MSILRYEGVNWSVPFLFANQAFYSNLVRHFGEIDIDLPVRDVYGFVRNKWNGYEVGSERLRNIGFYIKDIVAGNATPVINFSNYHLEEQDLKDRYCNDLLDYAVGLKAKFIISSDLLYDYIKSKYPNARLISSNIKALYEIEKGKESEFYNSLYDKYEMITLSPFYVKDGFLNDLDKYSDVSKFEVIVNDTCLKSCSKFKEHNEGVENFEMGKCEYIDYYKICPKNEMDIKDGITQTLVLSRKELDNLVYNAGIKNLRLNGYSLQPILFNELISSYIFNPIGNFQHVSWSNQ